jgi:DNA-binding NarL/FixJ family response regulator
MTSVLIVDDEELVRFGFQLVLSASPDIDTVHTCEGHEAFAAAELHGPDVVLLDVRMPRVNGLEVLDQFRALERPPAVAMLTTFDTEEHLGTALEKGAARFLLKDIAPEHLIDAVLVLAGGSTDG